MKQFLLCLFVVITFSACEKQGMEDVYVNRYPAEKYPPFISLSNSGAKIIKTDIPSLTSNDANIQFEFSWGRYINSSNNQISTLFNIHRVTRGQIGMGNVSSVLETSSYTYYVCKDNLIKIERVFNPSASQTNQDWDEEIVGYWVAYVGASGIATKKMIRLDNQKYIDLK